MNRGASRSLTPEETPTWCFYLGLGLAIQQARWSLAPGAGQEPNTTNLAHSSKRPGLEVNQTHSTRLRLDPTITT